MNIRNILTITLILILSLLYSDGTPPAGDGTIGNPYLISNLDNLLWLSTNSSAWSSHFSQIADIDASETINWNAGAGFNPIGTTDEPFTGNYNAAYYSIDNLTINRSEYNDIGLFGNTYYASINDLNLINVNITGNHHTGGIAGYSEESWVRNCTISGSISGHDGVGSITGWLQDGHITNCNADCSVNGDHAVGGITGDIRDSNVNHCSSDGEICGNVYAGGIAGDGFMINESDISYCSSTCNINCDDYAGGIIARASAGSILRCTYEGVINADDFAGGIAGKSSCLINLCNVFAVINAENKAGGIVCQFYYDENITNCYFEGSVNGLFAGGLLCSCYEDYYDNIHNCFYNYENVLINNEHKITLGALSNELFTEWINNDLSLDIDDYYDFDNDRYLVNSLNDFKNLLGFVYETNITFKLTADINLNDEPGFHLPYFCCDFNGDGHDISNLYISNPQLSYAGLFGNCISDNLTDVHIVDAYVVGYENVGILAGYLRSNLSYSSTSGYVESFSSYAGGLVGVVPMYNYSNVSREDYHIEHCFSSVDVNCPEQSNIGGLIGMSKGEIINCYATGSVTGEYNVGGLIGCNYVSTLKNCYSKGYVTGYCAVGGIAGFSTSSQITDCFSFSAVTGLERIGGIAGFLQDHIGDNYIEKCYAIGSITGNISTGGLVGEALFIYDPYRTCHITDSFWNTETSGQNIAVGEITGNVEIDTYGLNTQELQQIETYTAQGWDFIGETTNGTNDYWNIDSDINEGYPYLTDTDIVNNNPEQIIEPVTEFNIYPNPFNPLLNITFNLSQSQLVNITIFNIKGQKISTVNNGILSQGYHLIRWQADNMPTGVYFIILKTSNNVFTDKILLLK